MKINSTPNCQVTNFNPLSTLSEKEYKDIQASIERSLKGIPRADASELASIGVEHICEQSKEGKFNHLNPNDDLRGLCFRVAFNKALDELSKSKTKKKKCSIDQRDISEIHACAEIEEDDYYDFSEEKEKIREIVSCQKGKEVEVLKLMLSDCPDQEIADELGITLGNVRKSRYVASIRVAKEMYARGYRSKSGKLGMIGKCGDDAA